NRLAQRASTSPRRRFCRLPDLFWTKEHRMWRRIPVIALAVGGVVLLLSGAADPQQRHRPNRPFDSECPFGSTEQRVDCLSRELARQRIDILMLRIELESLRSPRVVPLFDDLMIR